MIQMDVKGQLSVEYILFLAFALLIVLIVVTYVGDQSELNSVATATRMGAVNATADIVIGSNNIPIRVNEISMNGSDPINVTIFLSRSVSNTQKSQILSSVNRSLASQSYNPNYNAINNTLLFTTNRHNYIISITT